jgi:hypothetical protein
MFSVVDSLGSPYKPTTKPKMDVSFVQVKQQNGMKNYIALVDDDENVGLPIDESETVNSGTEFSKLYKKGEIYATPTPDEDEDEKISDIFSLGNDPVKVFYIGSITVVGLYILYRILSKTK